MPLMSRILELGVKPKKIYNSESEYFSVKSMVELDFSDSGANPSVNGHNIISVFVIVWCLWYCPL